MSVGRQFIDEAEKNIARHNAFVITIAFAECLSA